MKIHLFGTSSGTEPLPGGHHAAFAVECGDALYWFDAGETCAYTAHRMGVDLMRIRKIVISHVHADHVGGLLHLLFCIRKLDGMHHSLRCRDIELYIPDLRVWDGFMQAYQYAEGGLAVIPDPLAPLGVASLCIQFGHPDRGFRIHAREYRDGTLFFEDGVFVSALHNSHLPHRESEPFRSFGFLMRAEGKRMVYSGDTGGVEDVLPLLTGCDLLLMEGGHHDPVRIAKELRHQRLFPKHLAFIHCKREILRDRDTAAKELAALYGLRVSIPGDGDVLRF